MKVHLIKKRTLEDFVIKNPTSRAPLDDWTEKIGLADLEPPINIKDTFNSADILGKSSNRVVFDIGAIIFE